MDTFAIQPPTKSAEIIVTIHMSNGVKDVELRLTPAQAEALAKLLNAAVKAKQP